jgi:hypothetical protein
MDHNPVSGRQEEWELCNKCYNEVVYASVKLLHDKRQENAKEIVGEDASTG